MATVNERIGSVRVGRQGTIEPNEEGSGTHASLLDLLIRELHLVPVELQLCKSELRSDRRHA